MGIRENQDLWLAALRSGKYKQGMRNLHKEDGSMCCLGVAAVIFKPEDIVPILDERGIYHYEGAFAIAPRYVCDALGIDTCGMPQEEGDLQSLAGLNDHGTTFSEIADIFEANRDRYTKKGLL